MNSIILIIVSLFSLFNSILGLNCFTCGVFLRQSEPQCKGPPKNNSCEPDNIGCLKIVGENLVRYLFSYFYLKNSGWNLLCREEMC